jgi:FHS family glucose/mannose:H+ symporter-like MFS transporter
MLAHWSVGDGGGGLLFLSLFLGSSSGAMLSRGRPTHSLARGACVLFPACVGLAFANGQAVMPLCFFYGLGLGITITSINLLRSQRRASARAREMNRLNLVWAFGASICPWLANEFLKRYSVRSLFLMLGAVFAMFALWTLLFEIRRLPSPATELRLAAAATRRLPLIIALATLLATGVESSTGAWIATYADRLRDGISVPVAAVSAFWLGLLISRALHSTRALHRLSEGSLLQSAAAIASLGCVLLVTTQRQEMLLVSGFLIGFGIGPVYPLMLAAVLPRFQGNVIFLMAGLGGATFPWLTGEVSSHFNALQIGFMVPAGAALMLLASMPLVSRIVTAYKP